MALSNSKKQHRHIGKAFTAATLVFIDINKRVNGQNDSKYAMYIIAGE